MGYKVFQAASGAKLAPVRLILWVKSHASRKADFGDWKANSCNLCEKLWKKAGNGET